MTPSLHVANYTNYEISKFRISISKLKRSVHSLNIELAIYNDMEYDRRICKLGDKREVEDEFH